jgi:hypothetical protein
MRVSRFGPSILNLCNAVNVSRDAGVAVGVATITGPLPPGAQVP